MVRNTHITYEMSSACNQASLFLLRDLQPQLTVQATCADDRPGGPYLVQCISLYLLLLRNHVAVLRPHYTWTHNVDVCEIRVQLLDLRNDMPKLRFGVDHAHILERVPWAQANGGLGHPNSFDDGVNDF